MSRLYRAAVLLGLLLGTLGVVMSFFPFTHEIEEDLGLGLLFKVRGVRTAPPEVVVVSIDKQSSEYLKLPRNPDRWPRSLHARLIETLIKAGAELIVFDVYFVEPRSPEEDNLLAAAIRKAGNVVLTERLEPQATRPLGPHKIMKVVEPLAPLSESAVATAPFVLPRLPIKVSKYWLFQTGAGDSAAFPVVAFQLFALDAYDDFVRLFERANPHQIGKLPSDATLAIKSRGMLRFMRDIRAVFKGDPLIPKRMIKELENFRPTGDVRRHRLLNALVGFYGGTDRQFLNYYGPARTVNTVPYYQALQLAEGSSSDDQFNFRGKAVFVGVSEIAFTERDDSYYTVFSQADGVFISGVEIAATAFANLLENMPVKPIAFHHHILLIFAWGVLVGTTLRMAPTVIGALAIVVISFVYFAVAQHEFKTAGTWYPVVTPLFLQIPLGFFGAVFWKYFESNQERQQIRKALTYYVPNEVVDELATNRVDIKRAGETLDGTCLFTDAAGYTRVSETMAAHEVSEFMRKYFEVTFAPIKRNGGLVADVTGDSIVAVWKSTRPDARRHACLAALGIIQAVRQFNESFPTLKLPTRVGVHAGQIFLGNIGAWDHYAYGATGDTINTASRMDSLNKYLSTEILVSEDAIHGLKDFLTREAGIFRFKGKTHPIAVHELLCPMEESDDNQKKACTAFSEGLKAFRQQSWDEAQGKLKQCVEYLGSDGLSEFYLRLCEQYRKHPPAGPWDGIILLEEK